MEKMTYADFKRSAALLAQGTKASEFKLMQFLVSMESRVHVWQNKHRSYSAVLRDIDVCSVSRYRAYKRALGVVDLEVIERIGVGAVLLLEREEKALRDEILKRMGGTVFSESHIRQLAKKLSPAKTEAKVKTSELRLQLIEKDKEVSRLKKLLARRDARIVELEQQLLSEQAG